MESISKTQLNNNKKEGTSENFFLTDIDKANSNEYVEYIDKDSTTSRTKFSIESSIILPIDSYGDINNSESSLDMCEYQNLNNNSRRNSNNINNTFTKSEQHEKIISHNTKAHKKNSKSNQDNKFILCNKVSNSLSLQILDIDKLVIDPRVKDKKQTLNINNNLSIVVAENLISEPKKVALSSKNTKVRFFEPNPILIKDKKSNELTLDGKRLIPVKKLGKGSYGSVYQLKDDKKNSYAIKKYRESQKIIIQSQISIIKTLKHSSLPKLYEYFALENTDYILQDYYPISLDTIINKFFKVKGYNDLANERTDLFVSLCYQIVSSIAYLHENQTIHRDIKPSNIMIDCSGNVKLIDFDLLMHLESESQVLSSNVSSAYYISPEILLGETKYGFGLDLWSVGCVLSEMYLCYPLFKEDDQFRIFSKIKNILNVDSKQETNFNYLQIKPLMKEFSEKDSTFTFLFKNCYEPFRNLIENFVQLDSSKRTPAIKALSSPYFKNMSYELSKKIIKSSIDSIILLMSEEK